MRFVRALLAFAVAALTAGSFGPSKAVAQGVTTAAVSGRITDTEGKPLPGIQIVVTNVSTGASRGALANADGRFMISGLQIGGPYRILATGIGYAPFNAEDFRLALGQNLNLPIQLAVQAVQLGALQILSEPTRAQVINPNRTGAEQLVTEHQISSLPTITRNFTDFIALSPLVGAGGGATSVGGANNRFNNIQIDGAVSQDLFGLGSTGQPGGQADARSISIEAVKEYQVLAAPYDVRQSGFTGGLINAVTKSGTNDFGGSLYAYYKNEELVRTNLRVDTTALIFGNFNNPLFGGSLGGPIIRDKLHFFVAGEFETNTRPASGVAIGREAPEVVGVDQTNADRFVTALQSKNLTAGTYTAKDTDNPNRNMFGRIDWSLSPTHTLTLRHNFVRAEDEVVNQRGQGATAYALDSNWYFFESTTHSSVGQLTSNMSNGMFNELTIGRNQIRDRRTPNTRFPQLQVSVTDTFGTLPITGAPRILTRQLRAGAETASQANELDQDSWEITNNLSFNLGRQRITVGVHDEYFKFRNLFGNNITGTWTFTSLANFEAGIPSQFTRTVPYTQGLDLNARFAVNTIAVYAQTELNLLSNFKVTAGVRYDHPTVLDKPANNPLFSDTATVRAVFGGRRLDVVPQGNGIISPRLGFNWDVFDNRDFQVRGGAGLFTGRHPYVWLSNIFTNNGLQTVAINCTGAGIPTFTTDPDNQPRTCNNAGTPQPGTAFLNLIDPDFEYPSNWRLNLAADKRLPYGIVATGEFIYTRAHKQIFARELNLTETPVGTTQGGRLMFGTVNAGAILDNADNNSVARPTRKTTRFLHIVELTNSNQDRSWSATGQLQKRFTQGFDLNASYTHQDAKDISGLTSSVATSNVGFNPIKGHPNTPELSTSDYETKHKIVLAGSWDVTSWFRTSLFYIGNSGDGYTFVVNGDNNADGYEASVANDRFNDLAYIPRNQADISLTNAADWTRLDTFLNSLPCANAARGRIMVRNECTEPWRNRLDTRFTFMVPTLRGQRAEVSADIFNVLNLLKEDWGRSEGMINATEPLLDLRGWDTVNNRGIYRLSPAVRNRSDGKPGHYTTFSGASRWQMQLGVRYAF